MPAPFDENERLSINERLVLGALDALRRGGLGAANVDQLARGAGIAKGSFYSFYPSKEHLFMEALERIEAEYRRRFVDSAAGPGSSRKRIERALTDALRMVEEEPALRFLDASAAERLARALPPERIAEHATADAEAAENILKDWKTVGLVRPDLDAAELGGALYAIFLVGTGLHGLPPELAESVRAVTVAGLAARLAADSREER